MKTKHHHLRLFAMLLVLGSPAQAATYTWTGTGTTNWNTTNWSGEPPVDPATGPTAADDAVFDQATARIIRMVGTSRAVNTISTTTNAAGLTIENAAAAAGSLAIGTLTQRSASSFQFRNATGLMNVTADNLLVESGILSLGTTATGDASSQWLNSLAVAAGTTLSNGTINVNVRNSNNTANTYDLGLLTVTAGTVNLNNSITTKDATANVQGLTGTGGVITGASGTGNTGTTTLVITAVNDYASGARLTNGASGGLLQVVKSGSGTQTLTGSNSYTGGTLIEGGVLELASTVGGAAANTSSLSVTNGATLLISQSNQVNNAAPVTHSGATIRRGGNVSEVFGSLSVTGGGVLDFGTGVTGLLAFGSYTPSALLTVSNFLPGNVLNFGVDLGGAISNQTLFSFDNGFTSNWNMETSTFTVTAIPEPSGTFAVLGVLACLVVAMLARRPSPPGKKAFPSASSAEPENI